MCKSFHPALINKTLKRRALLKMEVEVVEERMSACFSFKNKLVSGRLSPGLSDSGVTAAASGDPPSINESFP